MIKSHLLEQFCATPWHLHGPVYDRLDSLLIAHVTGNKDAWRAAHSQPLNFMSDEPAEPIDEADFDQQVDDVAVINLRGILAMHADQVNGECQPSGRSYESILSQLNEALSDDSVKAIVLRAETPGGAASGCQEVYDAIKAADAQKPVYGFINNYCFSAGVYLVAACRHVVASSIGANTGSIGTIMRAWDSSKAVEEKGYKMQVWRAGQYKAPFANGEALTEEASKEIQRTVDAFGTAFHKAVIDGRGLDEDQAAATLNGRTFMADEALNLGLIDGIQSFAAFLAAIHDDIHSTSRASQPSQTKEPAMFGNNKKNSDKTADASTGLSKSDILALGQEFPHALDRIAALDAPDATADGVALTLLREDRAAAQEQATAAGTQAAAEIAAKDGEIADLKAQLEAAQNFTEDATNTEDAGSDHAAESSLGDATGDDALKARWNAMGKEQQAEFMGDFDTFAFAMKHPELNNAAEK